MSTPDLDLDTQFHERCWFGAAAAVTTAEAECDVLRAVVVQAEAAWRRSRIRLAELEALRDAFAHSVTIGAPRLRPPPIERPRVRSAA